MTVLAIDTSTNVMGISLIKDQSVIGETITFINKNHSVRLMPAISSLMEECNIKPKELSKIVVAKGPGSYTGVRIGVTVAKSLAFTLKIPIIGVSSLKVLAANGRYFNGLVCPLFDARRNLLFTGLYDFRGQVINEVLEDCNIDRSIWIEKLKSYNEQILFIGNDVSIHKEFIIEHLKDKALFAKESMNNQRPSELFTCSLEEKEESVHNFSPEYLRLSEAEANWLASQEK
ncbi:tRNA (adenosine(37)-N6)-threonylcarbamoyltransferase complex dimerization subunit type 1 TsaB [Bacillus sp. AFS001701]|uniref:tRNA (adenosine(37)-N6)-threonylcarbamoyltransferase complex dimerization subunit type 1 TsaB n=1 Tax=Bacillaceae TaxID=186817 RepID=UPI000BF71D36|nr:tRNA (adenosine(37)-N6)-threonylcarbamoyltransferase complex dimerization subunit type 1 TsaB [Bacillus sp. AFS001701]PET76057.1 tRNA (adenosine(37)-N6)-threonylcarbamoyltransferase complex dimerization subunit type 1 TsaB [Bacillus sp. AFS001701]